VSVLATPRVWHSFGEGTLWLEWPVDDDWACQLEVVPLETESVVRRLVWCPRSGDGTVPAGGLSATLVRSAPFRQLETTALEHVRQMLDTDSGTKVSAQIAGFNASNADPVIRRRGGPVTPDEVFAAAAALYAAGPTRATLAERFGYTESQIKSWIEQARRRGHLTRHGRELTDSGRAILENDGREPDAIIRDWRRRRSMANEHERAQPCGIAARRTISSGLAADTGFRDVWAKSGPRKSERLLPSPERLEILDHLIGLYLSEFDALVQ
jgi:transposase-like protein